MFLPHAIVGFSPARATSRLTLLFLALQLPTTLAFGAGDVATSAPVAAEVHHPDHAHQAELADQDEHEATPVFPSTESNPGRGTSAHVHEGDSGHDEESHLDEPGKDNGKHANEHEEVSEVHLSPGQRQILDLQTTELEPRVLGETLHAPGEVRLNAYATAQVTPRIDAQVIARHARLGEHVERGQLLVTLSSVDMAEAQGDLIVAEREWQRLSKLKGQFVSESAYLEASVARQKAISRVLAYGMTQAQTDTLVDATSEKTDGTFELLAPQGGTVVRDGFVLGAQVEPGHVLFEITDESVRWVEARMPPGEAARISVGDHARVAYRDSWLEGRVTQIHHLLDETTRTQTVRVEVPDPEHRLHPGVFVDVVIFAGDGEAVLAVPEAAVLRGPDGDWQVFVADTNQTFVPVEVELLRTTGGMAVIRGLAAGTRVVTRGAFFLQSELAKSGFDPHNH